MACDLPCGESAVARCFHHTVSETILLDFWSANTQNSPHGLRFAHLRETGKAWQQILLLVAVISAAAWPEDGWRWDTRSMRSHAAPNELDTFASKGLNLLWATQITRTTCPDCANFGTCALDWPLMDQWEQELVDGNWPTDES